MTRSLPIVRLPNGRQCFVDYRLAQLRDCTDLSYWIDFEDAEDLFNWLDDLTIEWVNP